MVKSLFQLYFRSSHHLYFIFLSRVKINSINWPAPNIWVFIAQLVEHCSANAEAMGSNPVEALKFFSGLSLQLLKLRLQLRWSNLYFNCISAVHIIFILFWKVLIGHLCCVRVIQMHLNGFLLAISLLVFNCWKISLTFCVGKIGHKDTYMMGLISNWIEWSTMSGSACNFKSPEG